MTALEGIPSGRAFITFVTSLGVVWLLANHPAPQSCGGHVGIATNQHGDGHQNIIPSRNINISCYHCASQYRLPQHSYQQRRYLGYSNSSSLSLPPLTDHNIRPSLLPSFPVRWFVTVDDSADPTELQQRNIYAHSSHLIY
jgi:hypothetical protein